MAVSMPARWHVDVFCLKIGTPELSSWYSLLQTLLLMAPHQSLAAWLGDAGSGFAG